MSTKFELQTEALLCVGTIIAMATEPQLVKKLVSLNFMGILHEQLLEGPDHGVLQVQMLQCLSGLFRRLPNEANNFLRIYGSDVLER